MKKRFVFFAAAILAGSQFGASAQEVKIGDLVIGHPHARSTVPGAPTGAGYMTITNNGDSPDRLVGGSAAFADKVEIHEMSMQDNIMRMRRVEGGLEISPGETVALEPGGYHVMFIGLDGRLEAGQQRDVTLVFEGAGEAQVEFAVENIGAGRRGTGHGGVDHSGH